MTRSSEITGRLRGLGELTTVLDDLNVKWVTVAPNGHWSYEKLGRTRHGERPLDQDTIRRIASDIPPGRHVRSGEWAVRKYESVQGAALLIERLPVAVADRLPQTVLGTLKRQIKQDGNGVLVGQPGAGKGALLLWLALQIPDEPVLYVAENPPSEFPGNHITHVFPPSTPQERRALERFVRLTPTVMWDRIANSDDLVSLFGFPGARRRWFTLDSSSVRSAMRMLTAATQMGCDARFSTLLSLTSSVIGRPEARNMVVREEGEWNELFCADESCLGVLEAYETSDIRRLSPTEVSVPAIPLDDFPPPKVEVASDFAAEAESAKSPVEVATPDSEAAQEPEMPDEPSGLEEATDADVASMPDPHTVPVEVAQGVPEGDYDPDEAITGMLPREEVRELREQQMREGGDDEGEMLQSIKEATAERKVPEVTKHYVDMPDEVAQAMRRDPDVTRDGGEEALPENLQDEESAPETVPPIKADDLGVTSVERISESDLEFPDEDEPREFADSAEVADDSDYSGVFAGDLDFDSLAEEVLSEASEAIAEESSAAFAATNPEHHVVLTDEDIELAEEPDEFESAPTRTASSEVVEISARREEEGDEQPSDDEGDSTTQFTLDQKLLALRRRRQNDD